MIKATLFMELAILMSFGMLMLGIYIANYVLALIGVCLCPIMLYSIWKYEKLMDSFKVNINKKEGQEDDIQPREK